MPVWSDGPSPQPTWLASHLLAHLSLNLSLEQPQAHSGHMLGPTGRNTSGPLMDKISPFVIKLLRSSSNRAPVTWAVASSKPSSHIVSLSLPALPPIPPYYCSLEPFPNKVPLCMCFVLGSIFREIQVNTLCLFWIGLNHMKLSIFDH